MTQPLKLAEPNPISLNSNGPKVTSVIAGWGYYVRGGVMHPVNVNDDILPVSYDSRGGASVNVTPRRLGKVQLTLFVTFEDGGFERKKIDLQVGPSERPPEKLVITPGGGDTSMNHPVISLDLSDAHRTRYLNPSAIFKNVTSPVRLLPLEVTFRFISPLGTDAGIGTAAEIDPSTGILTARYVGQALLETTFEGVSVLTCIDVMKNVGGGRSSRCEEILPPGRSLPPDLHDLYPGPPPVAVKPPPRANTNPQ